MEVISDNVLKARGEAYQIFSALFCEPEEEVLGNKEIFHRLRSCFQVLGGQHESVVDELIAKFDKYFIQELLIDYTKIFLGPFEAIAHPYSSVYFGDKTLMNAVTTWVETFYNKCGLSFDYGIKDLPDHIVVELEFMYNLIFRECEALSALDDTEAEKYGTFQKEFANKHLLKWVGAMCDKIVQSEVNEYYTALCKCLMAFIDNERKILAANQN
jgi:putative dimethyl sulfoxide reductase chaperone